jgi:hypothetical protein
MKSPQINKKNRVDGIKATTLQDKVAFPARRLTDITPGSREISLSQDAPKSPKIHELVERSKFH